MWFVAGFVPNTGLNRGTDSFRRWLQRHILPWMPFATTPEHGQHLRSIALIACSPLLRPTGGKAILRAMVDELPEPLEGDATLYLDKNGSPTESNPLSHSKQVQQEWLPLNVPQIEALWREAVSSCQ